MCDKKLSDDDVELDDGLQMELDENLYKLTEISDAFKDMSREILD